MEQKALFMRKAKKQENKMAHQLSAMVIKDVTCVLYKLLNI